jgi:protein-L-isoaspartate(D-aspartate) O-methyltransferase
MAHVDFIERVHTSTKRDYVQRVVEYDKAECATISKQFGKDYWDGDRRYGYGGYNYDGRWRSVAEAMAKHYHLKPGSKILDVGCGKGYLLYEFTQVIPQVQLTGLDISQYAIDNAKEEVRTSLRLGNATELPFDDASFDFIVSINTLHNLYNYDLRKALQEIQRVGKGRAYIVVDSYRTEREKMNLLYWQITCECFYTPREWEWFFGESGYTGDYSYVFYE